MSNTIPSYLPDKTKKTSKMLPFSDERILNYLSIHAETVNGTSNKMDKQSREEVHNAALKSRDAEMVKLDLAYKSGKITKELYDTCKYMFLNVVNDYHDTSLVDNGYFLNMNEITNFVITCSNKENAFKLMQRYLFLTDMLVLESYSRHLVYLRSNNKILLKDAITQMMDQPLEVDFKQIGFKFRYVEDKAGTPCSKNKGNIESFLMYRRLHELREVSSVTTQDHNLLLEDLVTNYKAQIDDNINVAQMQRPYRK